MTPEQLAGAVRAAAAAALSGLGLDPSAVPGAAGVERPGNPAHSDYASALALRAGRATGVAPRALAEAIAGVLGADPAIANVEVAGPGFLNIRLSPAASGQRPRSARRQRARPAVNAHRGKRRLDRAPRDSSAH
jgi:arginyl-tRNA synthetase